MPLYRNVYTLRALADPEFKDWTGVSRKYAIPLLEIPGPRTRYET